MSGSTQKLYRILALSVFLLGFPHASLWLKAQDASTVVCEWPHPETIGDDGEMQQWSDGTTTDLAR